MREFVSIEGRALVPALKLIERLVERRNTYPILGMVLLKVVGADLVLRATDLDVELTATLDVIDSAGEWSICVPADVLLRIARLAGATTLELERVADDPDAPRLVVRAGHVTYDLDGAHPDSHPSIVGAAGPAIETFAPGRLAALLGKVAWCRFYEETRFYLNGVAWQFGPRGRRFVATDGHRMAICRYDDLPMAGAMVTRIIPNKAVDLLVALKGEIVMREVLREVGEPHLEAVAGDVVLRTKLIDCTGMTHGYPDVDRVIPGENRRTARFATRRDVLLDAIDRAMVFDDRSAAGRCLAVSESDGRITLGAKRPDRGGATVTLPDAWPDGGERFGVNGRYLRDLVRSCAPGDLAIWQCDADSPVTVLDGDTTMLRVVMPMRV